MTSNIANVVFPGEFNTKTDKWSEYKERLLCALDVAGVRDDDLTKARSLFLSQCGKETYSLIVSLLVPGRPTSVEFSEILAVLDKFYEPRVHEILQAESFHRRKQLRDESIQEFVAAIGLLGAKCNFTDLKRQLRDRLVLGVRDNRLRRELLQTKELTYETAVQLCLNEASSCPNNTELEQSPATPSSESKPAECPHCSRTHGVGERCPHCSRTHGVGERCPFIKAKCFYCKRVGHIASSCKKKSKRDRQQGRWFRNLSDLGGGSNHGRLRLLRRSSTTYNDHQT